MRRSYEQKGGFYTGRMNESDAFGIFKPTNDFRKKFQEKAGGKGYIPYFSSLELVRDYNQSDPTNPTRPFAKELRMAVVDALDLKDDEENRVKFYSAIGTPADVFHGVDAWIEYEQLDGERVVVTLDATTNKAKEFAKADVVIQEITVGFGMKPYHLRVVGESQSGQFIAQSVQCPQRDIVPIMQ